MIYTKRFTPRTYASTALMIQTKMPSNMENVKIKQEMQLYPLFLYLKVNFTQTISPIIYKRNKHSINN